MKKSLLFVVVLALLISSVAFADGDKTRVTIFQFKPEIADQLIELANLYMEEHPDVELVAESMDSSEYYTILKTRFAGGEGPEIFNNGGATMLESWKEYLEDLSDQPWVADMGEMTKANITSDGKVYGLPLYLESFGLLYNVGLFEKAGITETPETISELREACEKLQAAGITPFVHAFSDFYAVGNFLLPVGIAHAGDPYGFMQALSAGEASFQDTPCFQDWLDLVDLLMEFAMPGSLTRDFSSAVAAFANGEAAMQLTTNGVQLSAQQINPDIVVGMLPVPINDNPDEGNENLFIDVSTYWVINNESPAKEEAKEFMNWLVSSETGQHYLTDVFQFVPGLTSVSASEEGIGNVGIDMLEAVAADKVSGWYQYGFPNGGTEELGNEILKYIGGQISRDELLENMTDIWQNLS